MEKILTVQILTERFERRTEEYSDPDGQTARINVALVS